MNKVLSNPFIFQFDQTLENQNEKIVGATAQKTLDAGHSKNEEITETPPLVVIDPGHGGDDPGRVSPSLEGSVFQEKELTIRLAHRVNALLKTLNYSTHMTRERDIRLGENQKSDLAIRAEIANRQAYASKATPLFISLHFNSSGNQKPIHRIEIYYPTMKKDSADSPYPKEKLLIELSKNFAKACMEGIKSKMGEEIVIKQQDFGVIRQTAMPAILVEGGYIDTESAAKKVIDPNYQENLARGIANGIFAYLNNKSGDYPF